MWTLVCRLVSIAAMVFAPMAIVTAVSPGVSWAQCAGGEWWDPTGKVCDPSGSGRSHSRVRPANGGIPRPTYAGPSAWDRNHWRAKAVGGGTRAPTPAGRHWYRLPSNRGESALGGGRSAGNHPSPPDPTGVGSPESDTCPGRHRATIVLPIRMLAGNRAVVVDKWFDCLRRVDHLCVTIQLHIGAVEFVGQHNHTRLGGASDVDALGTLGVARHDHPAG